MIPSMKIGGGAMAFARSVLARAACADKSDGVSYARTNFGERVAHLVKSAVDAGGANTGDWGAELTSPEASEFFGMVVQNSVVGKLGLVQVPANVRTILLTNGPTVYWVGAGQPKPLTTMDLDGDSLRLLKVAAIIVRTMESVRFLDQSSEARFAAELVRACSDAIDTAFLDPDNDGVADEKPASVLYGVMPTGSTGDPAGDIAALLTDFDGDLTAAAFVTDPATAVKIALARDLGGASQFPDAGPRGGSILGLPLIVSRLVPESDSFGQVLALIDGSGIAYAGGGVRSDVSQEASVEMADDPNGAAQHVSMFQCNAVATLVEVGVNWKRVRDNAVAYIEGVDYTVVPS